MKIYFDENPFPQLAHGLKQLQEPLNSSAETVEVIYLPDEYGKGAKDEDWIPILGRQGYVIITHDLNIHRTRSQRDLYEAHGLGAFFFSRRLKKGLGTGILCNKSSTGGKKSKNYLLQGQNDLLHTDIRARVTRPNQCNQHQELTPNRRGRLL